MQNVRVSLSCRRLLGSALVILSLAAAPAAHAVDVVCPPGGSVTLSNPNAPFLGGSVSAIPSRGVIEQSVTPIYRKNLVVILVST